MFAHEKRVLFKRCGAAVRHVISSRARSDHRQLAGPPVRRHALAQTSAHLVLFEQAFYGFLCQSPVRRGEFPIDVKISVRVHRDHPLSTVASYDDPALRDGTRFRATVHYVGTKESSVYRSSLTRTRLGPPRPKSWKKRKGMAIRIGLRLRRLLRGRQL